MIPKIIEDKIKDMKLKEITECHRSGDTVYQVANKYILKISENIQRLEREKKINDYLKDKLPVSESVVFEIEKDRAYYLKTMVQGESLLEKNSVRLSDGLLTPYTPHRYRLLD